METLPLQLLYVGSDKAFRDIEDKLIQEPWFSSELDRSGKKIWRRSEQRIAITHVHDCQEFSEALHKAYFNAILIDGRELPGAQMLSSEGTRISPMQRWRRILATIEGEKDRERRFPIRRVAVMIGGQDPLVIDREIFELGQHHVAWFLRDRSLTGRAVGKRRAEDKQVLVSELWRFLEARAHPLRKGKKSLLLAGGGITGIYFELGVLKCLQDSMNLDLRDFDLFFGISAGAILSGLMANRYSIDEIIANMGGMSKEWKMDFTLRARHLNISSLPHRASLVSEEVWGHLKAMAQGDEGFSVGDFISNWAPMAGPVFDNSEVENIIKRLFEAPGRTDDFKKLKRGLFVGATDQDSREHVLFGAGENEDVPISKAIQASSAMNPFFPSVKIKGRYYTDGAVTRTSNLGAAIKHGAELIFLIDPFLPYLSEEAGYNSRHSMLWLIEQDFKTVGYTRFSQMSEQILSKNSNVSAYTFVPSNRMRKMMAENPFSTRYFHPIVLEAYLGTYRRLHQLSYKLKGDLKGFGIDFDLKPAAKRVRAIESAHSPDASLLLDLPPKRPPVLDRALRHLVRAVRNA
ncbi:patatin-like phospholipase family protein [Myxococcota bacterium]|nr:patatin-like phospholipase family protein [Myxococcota bacterium]